MEANFTLSKFAFAFVFCLYSLDAFANESIPGLHEPDFEDKSCLQDFAGLFLSYRFGEVNNDEPQLRQLADGKLNISTVSIQQFRNGTPPTAQVRTSTLEIERGEVFASPDGRESRTDIYCDDEGRIVNRRITYDQNPYGIRASYGRPHYEIWYSIYELRTEGDTTVVYYRRVREEYYPINDLSRLERTTGRHMENAVFVTATGAGSSAIFSESSRSDAQYKIIVEPPSRNTEFPYFSDEPYLQRSSSAATPENFNRLKDAIISRYAGN